jgi:hypothetical protein
MAKMLSLKAIASGYAEVIKMTVGIVFCQRQKGFQTISFFQRFPPGAFSSGTSIL